MQTQRSVCITSPAVLGLVLVAGMAWGQIGGKTAADGIFMLDDAEDLDLVASGVDRPWIPQFVWNGGLSAVELGNSQLTLAPDQSPIGALRYHIPGEYGYINKSFGVPVPSVAGESTLPYPGNIVEFSQFEFLIAFEPALEVQEFWLILETYPKVGDGETGEIYPRILWQYHPIAGSTFRRVSIPIHEPTLILDGEGFTLEELLSQTRFLAFWFYGEVPLFPITQFNAYIDDITILPNTSPPPEPRNVWMIY